MPLIFYYKLTLNSKTIYVGSTTNFNERQRLHCLASNTDHKLVYQTIREGGGWIAVNMQFLERPYCIDSEHRRAREQFWLEILKPTCNLRKAYAGGVAV
jgi:hypothetical protein